MSQNPQPQNSSVAFIRQALQDHADALTPAAKVAFALVASEHLGAMERDIASAAELREQATTLDAEIKRLTDQVTKLSAKVNEGGGGRVVELDPAPVVVDSKARHAG